MTSCSLYHINMYTMTSCSLSQGQGDWSPHLALWTRSPNELFYVPYRLVTTEEHAPPLPCVYISSREASFDTRFKEPLISGTKKKDGWRNTSRRRRPGGHLRAVLVLSPHLVTQPLLEHLWSSFNYRRLPGQVLALIRHPSGTTRVWFMSACSFLIARFCLAGINREHICGLLVRDSVCESYM